MPPPTASTGDLPQHRVAEPERKRILDPEGPLLRISKIACYVSPFVGLLLFYVPQIDDDDKCLDYDHNLAIALFVTRLVLGVLSLPLVIFHSVRCIEDNVTSKSFFWNVFWVSTVFMIQLPLPRYHFFGGFAIDRTPTAFLVSGCMLCIVPWMVEVILGGRSFLTRMRGAMYYVYNCALLINFVGASWYFCSINSELHCWAKELTIHRRRLLDDVRCGNLNQTQVSQLSRSCSFAGPSGTLDYGIYTAALKLGIVKSSTKFFAKWSYCFFWALRNLSSIGHLETTTDPMEIAFATAISILGMLSFTMVLGGLQVIS